MDPSGSCFHHDGPLGVPQCATHITCSPAPVLFLLSFVSCRLDQKFPPRSLMSVPEKCARPVSAGVGWPRSACDRAGGMSQSAASSSCPPLVHLATPCPRGPKFSLSWGAFPPGSVCCFNCVGDAGCGGQRRVLIPWLGHRSLVFIQLAQAQNLGEALSSFLEVFLNIKHIHSSVSLRRISSLREA